MAKQPVTKFIASGQPGSMAFNSYLPRERVTASGQIGDDFSNLSNFHTPGSYSGAVNISHLSSHGMFIPSLAPSLRIDERMMLFLWEMVATAEERGLFAELRAKPNDHEFRGICADYLTDKGRLVSAEMVRNGWTPGGIITGNIA